MTLQGDAVRQERGQNLKQSDGGGSGGQNHQQIEQHTEDGTSGTHVFNFCIKFIVPIAMAFVLYGQMMEFMKIPNA